MLSRLYWITVSYFTRRLVWVLLATAGVLLLLDERTVRNLDINSDSMTYPRWQVGGEAVAAPQHLQSVRQSGRQNKVTWLGLSSLWIYAQDDKGKHDHREAPDAEFFQLLDEFPNLRFVGLPVLDDERTVFERLARLPHLQEIVFHGPIDEGDLARLAALRTVRRITFRQVDEPLRGIEHLAALPLLDTIVFEVPTGLNDQTLAEIATLPHLKTLVIDFGHYYYVGRNIPVRSDREKVPVTVDGLSALANAPSLRRLYAGSQRSAPDRELLRRALHASLPGIAVMPARVLGKPFPFVTGMLFALSAAVAVTLSRQFLNPLCRLARGYAFSHALVAVTFLAAIVLLGTARFISAGSPWNEALVNSLALVATMVAVFVSFSGGERIASPNLLRVTMVLCGGVLAILFPEPYQLIYYSAPWVAIPLVMMALVAALLTVLRLQGSVEAAVLPSATAADRNVPAPSPWKALLLGQREGRVQQLRCIKHWSRWATINRWRIGTSPVSSFRIPLLFGGSALAGIAFVTWKLDVGPIDPMGGVVFLLSAQLGACAVIGVQWRQRVRILPLESTRPVETGALRTQWATAVCVDLLPIILFVAIVGAVTSHLAWPAGPAPLSIAIRFIAYAVLATSLAFALAAGIIVVRRGWLAVALLVGLLALCLTGFITLLSLRAPTPTDLAAQPPDIRLPFIHAQLWLPVTLCLAFAAALYYRWHRLEADRFA